MIDLREVMRRWVTGVSIVTAEHNGHHHGATVNSLTSISIEPPIIAVTLAKGTRIHQMVLASGLFGVTLLAKTQQPISEIFSGKVADVQDRFEGLAYHVIFQQVPVLNGGLAALGCRVVHQYEMPNSTLFAGEVLAAELGEAQPPLVYVNRGYTGLEE